MRKFDELFEISAERKGGVEALKALLDPPASTQELEKITNDRWLAQMTKCVFQAGFNWKVVNSMWPGFEEAFNGFDTGYCAMLTDEDFDRLVSDKRIVRYGAKIKAVQHNAFFINQLARESGSAGAAFAKWPSDDYSGLLAMLKKCGARLGGNTGQYFLRFMGVDSYILSRDVVARLVAEGVIEKAPTSQKAMASVQEAFNSWRQQSNRSLTEISKVLAMSVG
jgi:3-methyladenine DNA glycosylase Tag